MGKEKEKEDCSHCGEDIKDKPKVTNEEGESECEPCGPNIGGEG